VLRNLKDICKVNMSIVNEYSTYDDISLETSSWTVYASGATQIIDIDPSGNVVRTTISIPTATGKTISVVTDNAGISQINTVDSEGTVLTSTSVQNTSSSSPITRLIPRSDSYAISTPSSVTIAAVDILGNTRTKSIETITGVDSQSYTDASSTLLAYSFEDVSSKLNRFLQNDGETTPELDFIISKNSQKLLSISSLVKNNSANSSNKKLSTTSFSGTGMVAGIKTSAFDSNSGIGVVASTDFGSASRIPSVKRSAKLALVGSTEDTEVTASLSNVQLTPSATTLQVVSKAATSVSLQLSSISGSSSNTYSLQWQPLSLGARYKCTDSLTNSYIIYGLWPNTTYSVNASLIQTGSVSTMNTGIRETTDIVTSARITAFDVTAGNPYSSSTISFTFSGNFSGANIYYGTVSGVYSGVFIHTGGTQATSTVLTEIEDNQVVSELTPNSTFYFAIAPVNILGEVGELYATELVASTNGQIVSFVPGEVTTSSVQLTFSGFFAGVNIYYSATSGGSEFTTTVSGAGSTSAVISGLSTNTIYYFRISSINNDGREGAGFGTELAVTTFGVITSFSTVDVCHTDVRVAYAGTYSGVKLVWDTVLGGSTFTQVVSGESSSSTGTAVVSNLTPDATYYMRIRPINSAGAESGDFATALTFTTLNPNVSEITSFVTGSIFYTSVEFTFGGTFSSAIIYYGLTTGSTTNQYTVMGCVTMTSSATITGLLSGTRYYFNIAPVNYLGVQGTTFPTERRVTTISETTSSIDSFSVGTVTTSSITLAYAGSYSNVRIQYGLTAGSATTTLIVQGMNTTSAVISGLTVNTQYFFRITPYDGLGALGTEDRTELSPTTLGYMTSFAYVLNSLTSASAEFTFTGFYSSVKIYFGTTSGSITNSQTFSGAGTTSGVVTGLVADTSYYFNVVALNSNSDESAMYTEITLLTLASITSFALGSVDTSNATLTFSGIYSSVLLYYGLTQGGLDFTQTLAGAAVSQTTVSDLSSNVEYFFNIEPVNSSGVEGGLYGTELNATTEASIDSFAVIGAFASIVSIPVSFSGYFGSVRVFYGTRSGTTNTSAVFTGSGLTSGNVTGLNANTLYYLSIAPINNAGAQALAYGTELIGATASFIASFSVKSIRKGVVNLTYSGSYDGVRIYYDTQLPNAQSNSLLVMGSGKSADLTGLVAGTNYFLSITSINVQGTLYAHTNTLQVTI
jgi:hypothetical protein